MSGLRVSTVLRYAIATDRSVNVSREVIWPMLRTRLKPGEPDYLAYRAYLRRTYADSILPRLRVDGADVPLGPSSAIELNGTLVITHYPAPSLQLRRTLFPSTTHPAVVEQWELRNTGRTAVEIDVRGSERREQEVGHYGRYTIAVRSDSLVRSLRAGETAVVGTYLQAFRADSPEEAPSAATELSRRAALLARLRSKLRLETPEPLLNTAFEFAKVRAAESVFATRAGLMHSPGGGRYYAGVWANDQVEYAGPFFPFLGYGTANEASLNAYRIFAARMRPGHERIPSSFEMEGDLPCCSKDRGDAAMFAYGASAFALALGKREIAAELWPAVVWGLEYSRRRMTRTGVIASETDEMEGRIPTGDANLSTSSLTHGGLLNAARLARVLEKADTARIFEARADSLRASIERHFGARIGGADTYRYFAGHEKLRHWAVLPITMGIPGRAAQTIETVFGTLWTPARGLEVERGTDLFWDRGTLYGLRAAFQAGNAELGHRYLREYTRERTVGRHVPYAVEAWPEGGAAHLSAESALYARIFTEGIFGITPTGLRSFDWKPSMPLAWNHMVLRDVEAFGGGIDLEVRRVGTRLRVRATQRGQTLVDREIAPGETAFVSTR